jgi:sodium transport system permease protein
MIWSNVKLILFREIRDQLRDRRTLFVIAVLPVLLYPLLWMSFLQVAQFMQEKSSKVLIVGARSLADLPPLAGNGLPAGGLVGGSEGVSSGTSPSAPLLELHFAGDEPRESGTGALDPLTKARRAVERGEYDAAVYFPPDFAEQLEAFREAIPQRRRPDEDEGSSDTVDTGDTRVEARKTQARLAIPRPEIICSTASEKSQIAYTRVRDMLERWRQEIIKQKLLAVGLPTTAAKPFDVTTADVAEKTGRRGTAVWSKVLPVLLLLWAMTGAFYPAVDLCAGEKERGTLETLLCSPAERSEIVVGKLLTVMIFSMATAVWNLVMMGASGWLLLAQLPQFGPPPAMAAVWLGIVLAPVSALFSALSLALAAFARSAKEGQYYFLPVLLVTMPLVVLPVAPGVELNLGNSLIPVSGLVLLLRSMLEGNFWQAWPFAFPVAGVTLVCCLLAIRWAIDQFNSESVLFREGERMDVALWLRHLVQDRPPTPTVAAAAFCGAVILLVRFFTGIALPQPDGSGDFTFGEFTVLIVVGQLAAVAAPALLLTAIVTRSPRKTLLLFCPRWLALPAAALLALLIQPAVQSLQVAVTVLYPPSEANRQMLEAVERLIVDSPWWQVLLLVAVMPAVFEELAFRGFILSGFRHLGHKWRAIVYSALLFGVSHLILQQSIITSLVGVLIGYLAVQSGSILPGMVFHMIHNALLLTMARVSDHVTPKLLDRWEGLEYLVWTSEGGMLFRWPVVVASALAALALLRWFHRLPYPKSPEEQDREALRQAARTED